MYVRCHIVEEFNKGIYDYIIATDENIDASKTSNSILRHTVNLERKLCEDKLTSL